MPELPDIVIYVETLVQTLVDHRLERTRLVSPFVLRSVDPPLNAVQGRLVTGVRRLGKRIILQLEGDLFLVLHLMIAGRLHWRKRETPLSPKTVLLSFDFPHGSLHFTEASPKKRASLNVVRGEAALRFHDPGGLEPLDATPEQLGVALRRENHTLKRALTDPTILSGIGNAYSDEILHRARLSPFEQTQKLSEEALTRLHAAMRDVLAEWIDRLRTAAGDTVPEKVTAFREGMAVHGRYGQPCPTCGSPVQRIVYSENEANYCATCQTGGKLLADRALSRLLKADWPKTLDDLERKMSAR